MMETMDPQYSQSIPSQTMRNQQLRDAIPLSRAIPSSCCKVLDQYAYDEVITSLEDNRYLCQKLNQIVAEWALFQVFRHRRQHLPTGCRNHIIKKTRILKRVQLLLLLLLATINITSSLQQGHEFCSCSPQIFRWRLDFTQLCFDNEISSSDGVAEASCNIYLWNNTTEEIIINNGSNRSQPVVVTSYKMIEFGSKFGNQINLDYRSNLTLQPLYNGQFITFKSITKSYPNVITSGISIHLDARNHDGEDVSLDVIIRYDNNCGNEIFQEGESLGWLVFVSSVLFIRCIGWCVA